MTPIWHNGTAGEIKLLDTVITEVMAGTDPRMPRPCPTCRSDWPSLHMFFRMHEPSGIGGLWVWCSNCGIHEHERVRVPQWWRNLEGIELKHLYAVPDYLETFADAIDAHWATLLTERKDPQ